MQTEFTYVGFLSSGMSSGMMGRNVPDVNKRSISSASACSHFVAVGPRWDFLYVIVDPSGFRFSGPEGETGGKHGLGIIGASVHRFPVGVGLHCRSLNDVFERCETGAATNECVGLCFG
jgi:hypothetical protein